MWPTLWLRLDGLSEPDELIIQIAHLVQIAKEREKKLQVVERECPNIYDPGLTLGAFHD